MERFAIKINEAVLKNLYKICRLCGMDNKIKVPILEDLIILGDLTATDGEPELREKICDCVGIQVDKYDKMPQTICSLCNDKINDFFEFREMCAATNIQTRKLLGLPPETIVKSEPPIKAPKKESILGLSDSKKRRGKKASEKVSNTFEEIERSSFQISLNGLKNKNRFGGKKKLKTDALEKAPTPLSACRIKLPDLEAITTRKLEIPETKTKKKYVRLKKKSVDTRTVISTASKRKIQDPMDLLTEKPLNQREKSRENSSRKNKQSNLVTVVQVPNPLIDSPPNKKPRIDGPIKCDICIETFDTNAERDEHMHMSHVPNVPPYHCCRCSETLHKSDEIKNHNLWHRLSKTPFNCGRCDRQILGRSMYTRHVQECNVFAAESNRKKCGTCYKTFANEELFALHQCSQSVFGKTCSSCNKKFAKKQALQKHIKICRRAKTTELNSTLDITVAQEDTPHLDTYDSMHSDMDVPRDANSSDEEPMSNDSQNPAIAGSTTAMVATEPQNRIKKSHKNNLKRYEAVLKSSYLTLVSIKQEEKLETSPETSDMSVRDEQDSRIPINHLGDTKQLCEKISVVQIKQEISDEATTEPYEQPYDATLAMNIKKEPGIQKNPEILPATGALKLTIRKSHGTLNACLTTNAIESDKRYIEANSSGKKKKKKKNRIFRIPRELAIKIKQEKMDRGYEEVEARMQNTDSVPTKELEAGNSFTSSSIGIKDKTDSTGPAKLVISSVISAASGLLINPLAELAGARRMIKSEALSPQSISQYEEALPMRLLPPTEPPPMLEIPGSELLDELNREGKCRVDENHLILAKTKGDVRAQKQIKTGDCSPQKLSVTDAPMKSSLEIQNYAENEIEKESSSGTDKEKSSELPSEKIEQTENDIPFKLIWVHRDGKGDEESQKLEKPVDITKSGCTSQRKLNQPEISADINEDLRSQQAYNHKRYEPSEKQKDSAEGISSISDIVRRPYIEDFALKAALEESICIALNFKETQKLSETSDSISRLTQNNKTENDDSSIKQQDHSETTTCNNIVESDEGFVSKGPKTSTDMQALLKQNEGKNLPKLSPETSNNSINEKMRPDKLPFVEVPGSLACIEIVDESTVNRQSITSVGILNRRPISCTQSLCSNANTSSSADTQSVNEIAENHNNENIEKELNEDLDLDDVSSDSNLSEIMHWKQ